MNLLGTRSGRRWLFAALYLSEGAPIGFIWWALPTVLRGQGVALASITTLTSLATLPWVLKFLVAPLIDAGLMRGMSVRAWILGCQSLMIAALLPLAMLDWQSDYTLFVGLIVGHAVCAAAQDVGIDTLAVRTVPEGELGRINGWMQAGMLAGRAAVAAGAVLLIERTGSPAGAVVALAALIAAPGLLLAFATAAQHAPAVAGPSEPVMRLLFNRRAVAGIAVALLAGAGFEFFGVSAGPRLVDAAVPATMLAAFYGLLVPGSLAAGSLAGGLLTDLTGKPLGTAVALLAVTATTGAVALSEWWPALDSYPIALGAATYFTIGALTASSYALLMSLSTGALAATRISLFMAMTNACEAWSGFAGGRLAAAYGYGAALLVLTALALLALVPLAHLGGGRERPSRGAAAPSRTTD